MPPRRSTRLANAGASAPTDPFASASEPLVTCLLRPLVLFFCDDGSEGEEPQHTPAWFIGGRMAQTNVAWRKSIRNWRNELIELVMTMKEGASEAIILSIARLCPQLRKLSLDEYHPGVGADKCCALTDKSAAALAKYCSHLRELETSGACPSALTDRGLAKLTRGCPNLVSLDLDADSMTASVRKLVKDLGNHCPMLRHLDIHIPGAKDAPSDAEVLGLIRGCPELTFLGCSLDISAPATLLELADRCSFETLCLEAFRADLVNFTGKRSERPGPLDILPLTDAFILALARNSPRLKCLWLGPSWKYGQAGAEKIMDAAWKTLARSCLVLRHVDLDCELGDDVINEFTKTSGLRPGLNGEDAGDRVVDGKRKHAVRWVANRHVLIVEDRPRYIDEAPLGTRDGDETLEDASEDESDGELRGIDADVAEGASVADENDYAFEDSDPGEVEDEDNPYY